MDRRWLNFFIVASLILWTSMLLRSKPEKKELAEGEDPAQVAQVDEDADGGDGDDSPDDAPSTVADPDNPDTEADAEAGDGEPEVVATKVPLTLGVLGSLDPQSPYRMQVVWTNRGAAIEQIELNDPRYRELSDPRGDLGYLHLTSTNGEGATIGVVSGPALGATPAQAASGSLQAGDTIVAIDDTDIAAVDEYDHFFMGTKPGQQILLTVRRADETLKYAATLGPRPLALIKPEFDVGDPSIQHPLSFLMTIGKLTGTAGKFSGADSLLNGNWEVVPGGGSDTIAFRMILSRQEFEAISGSGESKGAASDKIEIVKRYQLARIADLEKRKTTGRDYHLTFDFEVTNLGTKPTSIAWQLGGPTGLPTEGAWYTRKTHPEMWHSAGLRDVAWWSPETNRHVLKGCSDIVKAEISEDRDDKEVLSLTSGSEDSTFSYAGIDTQYFGVVLQRPEDAKPADYRLSSAKVMSATDEVLPSKDRMKTDVSFQITSNYNTISPGETFKRSFTIFAGPKRRDLLDEYGLQDMIVYGWFWFVVKPLLGVLTFFYAITGNYGIAIICLTVLVRGCLFPLGRKMARNAQKMQELAPEMKRIADKYKDDMEKRAKAQQELFKRHSYNPLGGCGLMFFQLPVFIGLFSTLRVAIELRQSPLIPGISWCSNLAGPDMLWYWGNFMPDFLAGDNGWLGPYLNLLPLISVCLFVAQQKLFTPPAMDEQQRMQQKMMSVMTLMIGVMFFKVPSGLCLYIIISSIWGITERKLLPKSKPPEQQVDTAQAKVVAEKLEKREQRAKNRKKKR